MGREQRIAFVGRKGLGGVDMRGRAVATLMGVPFIEERDIVPNEPWDVLILVKYWSHAERLRRCAKRLIFDPLDCWSSNKQHWRSQSEQFWFWCWDQLQFDDVLATSLSCAATMADSVGKRAKVHRLSHHADPRINGGWCNKDGPVVYAGGGRYIEAALPAIKEAVKALGLRLVCKTDGDASWSSIKGASCVLHPRCAPHDTLLNRRCKPQVKLENAIAAGIPIVATDDPCVLTSRPKTQTVAIEDVASEMAWKFAIRDAIERGPIYDDPRTIADHVIDLWQILGEDKAC